MAASEEPLELKCPICGDNWVHLESVRVITGNNQYVIDQSGLKGDGNKAALERALDMRGAIIEIGIWCENGVHRGTIQYAFHKGQTFISNKNFRVDESVSDLWRD